MPSNTKEYQQAYRAKNNRKVVSVSMSADDFREIQRYAKEQKLSTSALLREASLHQCRASQLHSPQVQEEVQNLRFLLSNVANNMNQMAYHSNRLRGVMSENAVLQCFADLDELLRSYVSDRMKP